jgi:hypothetical protein
MKLTRSIFCASAIGLAVSAAFAEDYDYSAEERGLSVAPVPPSVDESGTVRNPSALNTPDVIVSEEAVIGPAPAVVVAQPGPAVPAIEQPSQVSVKELFERLDTNNDDRIGPQEAKADAALDRLFERADRNNTNALDRGEFEDAVRMSAPIAADSAGSADALFARYDANRDGMISTQEAQTDPELLRWFAAADSDRNGALTRSEFGMAVDIAASEHRERASRG